MVAALEGVRVVDLSDRLSGAYAPHGIYPSRDGEWLALAAETGGEWRSLAEHTGRADLATEPRSCSAATRKSNEDAIDEIVAEWCREQDAAEAAHALGGLGLCSARVEVFGQELGMTDDEYAQLEAAGVTGTSRLP